MHKNKDTFTILSICHFIVGALSFLMSFIPFIYLVIGFALIIFPDGLESGSKEQGIIVGWVFLTVATLAIIIGLSVATATMFAGFYLNRMTRYRFCFTVAAIECLFFPFGTALGAVTLMFLSKEESKQAFMKPVQTHERNC